MHADLVALSTCTPACMPARQNLHTHLRASYILLIYMLELIRGMHTRGLTHVELMFVKYKLLLLNHHKHYECTSSGSEDGCFNYTVILHIGTDIKVDIISSFWISIFG